MRVCHKQEQPKTIRRLVEREWSGTRTQLVMKELRHLMPVWTTRISEDVGEGAKRQKLEDASDVETNETK